VIALEKEVTLSIYIEEEEKIHIQARAAFISLPAQWEAGLGNGTSS
jgi:hypothetical protein